MRVPGGVAVCMLVRVHAFVRVPACMLVRAFVRGVAVCMLVRVCVYYNFLITVSRKACKL